MNKLYPMPIIRVFLEKRVESQQAIWNSLGVVDAIDSDAQELYTRMGQSQRLPPPCHFSLDSEAVAALGVHVQ